MSPCWLHRQLSVMIIFTTTSTNTLPPRQKVLILCIKLQLWFRLRAIQLFSQHCCQIDTTNRLIIWQLVIHESNNLITSPDISRFGEQSHYCIFSVIINPWENCGSLKRHVGICFNSSFSQNIAQTAKSQCKMHSIQDFRFIVISIAHRSMKSCFSLQFSKTKYNNKH